MPNVFRFPFAHSFWVPFRLDPLSYDRGTSPGIQVVARLAPGAALEMAQSELAVLGAIAAAESPGIGPLDQASAPERRLASVIFWMITGLTCVTLLLSLVGIHAVFSFVTTQRTREMGIRIALGGRPLDVAGAVFRRPAIQIGLGIAVGLSLASGLAASGGMLSKFAAFVAMYGSVIFAMTALAIAAPVRRALRVSPAEALRAE